MEWPYWVMVVVVAAELRGYLGRRLGRVEGWLERDRQADAEAARAREIDAEMERHNAEMRVMYAADLTPAAVPAVVEAPADG
jgi:hypothetical protein